MSPQRRRLIKRLLRTFLPIVLVIVVAVAAVTVWLVRGITRPPRAPYLVTPETLAKVTGPITKADDVTWRNNDGTESRGWLIRGAEGAPAVLLLHSYGADRSWLLNLAVKLSDTTSFTVLWPDLRGHGDNPPVKWSLLGTVEGDDTSAAIDYLKNLKTPSGKAQVGGGIGLYGVELGAFAVLRAAGHEPDVRAIVLDSVPASADEIIYSVTNRHAGMNNPVLQSLARWGIKAYSYGKYQNLSSCELARSLKNVRVLLLTGADGDPWRASTLALNQCFANGSVELKSNLPLTGANLPSSTGEQEEAYDRPVIDFYDKALR